MTHSFFAKIIYVYFFARSPFLPAYLVDSGIVMKCVLVIGMANLAFKREERKNNMEESEADLYFWKW